MLIKGNLFLRDGFCSCGEVLLLGASIGGDLDCRRGQFESPVNSLSADRASIGGGVYLNDGFRANGEVRFVNARVAGNLICANGIFIRADDLHPDDRHTLTMDGIVVGGDICLGNGFESEGVVSLIGAQIEGSLDCEGSQLRNASSLPGGGDAVTLRGDGVTVRGCIFFRNGFSSRGHVEIVGARIDNNLECIRCTFDGRLQIEGTSVKGGFHWLQIGRPDLATLVLYNSKVGRILDDSSSWPTKGSLHLDGFEYDRVSQGPKGAKERLKWLELGSDFAPQPYRQFASVLRREGDDRGARQVLFEMEHQRTGSKKQKWYSHIWRWILRATVGYGYFPAWSLAWLVAVILAGWLIFWSGYRVGMLVPVDKEAYAIFKSDGTVLGNYTRFHPFIYSADNALPLVKLGQVDHWQPDPNPDTYVWRLFKIGSLSFSASGAEFLLWVRWLQIFLGWFLTSMGVAAISGIVRRE